MRVDSRNKKLSVLVVLLAGLWFALRPELPSASSTPLLLPGLEPERARHVVVEDPAGAQRVELVRGEGGWTLPGRFGLEAYAYAVDALLTGLASVRRADLVSDQASSWPVYGVGEGALRVLVTGAGGTVLADVVQGSALRPGDVEGAARLGTFLRVSSETAVYRAPLLAPLQAVADAWLDTRLLDLDPQAVSTVTLAEDTLEEVSIRRLDGHWTTAKGSRVATVLVEEFLERLTSAHLHEPVAAERAPEHGFEGIGAWSVALGDPPAVELAFAPATMEGQLVQRGDGAVVRLTARTADLLAEAQRALASALEGKRP